MSANSHPAQTATPIAASADTGAKTDAAAIMRDPKRHAEMRIAARRLAESNSWDRVFERLYEQYRETADLHPLAVQA